MRIFPLALALVGLGFTAHAADDPVPTGATTYGEVQTVGSPSDNDGVPALVGNVYNSDGQCYIHSSCGLKGIGWWRELQNTLKSAPAADPDNNGEHIFWKYYGLRFTRLFDVAGGYLAADFNAFGVTPPTADGRGDDYYHWAVFSKTAAYGALDPAPVYEFSINTKTGVIISWYADWQGKDSQKKLSWAESVAQTVFRQQKDATSTTVIQWIVFHSVLNPGANDLLEEIARANNADPKQESEWRVWTPADPYFISLIGVDPVREVTWMLNDHTVFFGRQTVVEIHTRGVSMTPKRAVEIWVKLGAYDAGNPQPMPG
ncbi:MAG: hypothetical protein Q9170_003799 [Blastenia crenularia]